MKTCLTIAGSDSSGGAGVQADLKTFVAHGVYGMSAITAITAQNTLGVQHIDTLCAESVNQQIISVLSDIPADAIKIGMLANKEIIQQVAHTLSEYQTHNVVLDPVMISTSGSQLLSTDAVQTLLEKLVPCVDVITPNVAELLILCQTLGIATPDQEVDTNQLEQLSRQLIEVLPKRHNGESVAILSKGGHLNANNESSDLLIDANKQRYWFSSKRVDTTNTHGTGCTLSAAICANLAKGQILDMACRNAKDYVQRGLESGLNLGQGNGPLNHFV